MKPRHAPPLNALRAFEAAARSLSFQKAATQLFVTPAAVSHQVKRLEAYLGTELFERGHRAVTLTAQGATLAASLAEIFGMLDLALDRAAPAEPGHLRVSTMESFAAKWLAPRLHRFHEAHPDIHVRVLTTDQLVDVGQEQVDVAIRYGLGTYPGVQVEKLMDARCCRYAPRARHGRMEGRLHRPPISPMSRSSTIKALRGDRAFPIGRHGFRRLACRAYTLTPAPCFPVSIWPRRQRSTATALRWGWRPW